MQPLASISLSGRSGPTVSQIPHDRPCNELLVESACMRACPAGGQEHQCCALEFVIARANLRASTLRCVREDGAYMAAAGLDPPRLCSCSEAAGASRASAHLLRDPAGQGRTNPVTARTYARGCMGESSDSAPRSRHTLPKLSCVVSKQLHLYILFCRCAGYTVGQKQSNKLPRLLELLDFPLRFRRPPDFLLAH